MSIRVLHIVTYMGRGGLETMLMNYYRHMDREKVQFDFLVHRDFEADYDAEIETLGGKIYHISRLIPWSNSYKKKLKSFFMEHPEYKIVHVHQDCLSSVALKCAKECGIPVRIVHSHNSNQSKNWKYLVKKYYMRKIPRYATDFFACGEKAGDWMFGKHEYSIMHNAINASDFEYSYKEAIKVKENLNLKNNIVIGHIGRFDDQKNHAFLINIFMECIKMNNTVKLLLIGDGSRKLQILKKVETLGIEDKVIFLGVRSDVNKIMQGIDVFVFPSKYEGVPVTMIEAQAAGLPCVISERVPEECIITKGLVNIRGLEESPVEWAKEILNCVRKNKKNSLDEIVSAGYDINTEVDKLQKFYLEKYKR